MFIKQNKNTMLCGKVAKEPEKKVKEAKHMILINGRQGSIKDIEHIINDLKANPNIKIEINTNDR